MDKILQKILGKIKGREWMVAVAGTLIFILACYQFIFVSINAKMRGLQNQVASREKLLAEILSLERRKSDILAEYTKVKGYCFLALSEKEMMTRVLKEVEKITQDSNVNVVSLFPVQDFTSERNCRKYQIELQVEGDTRQIFLFLNAIQSSSYLLKVERFSLTSKGAEGTALKFDSTISFIQYVSSS